MSGISFCFGSAITRPSVPDDPYMIRIGGEFGGEPSGGLQFPGIEIDDCNSPTLDLLGDPDFTAPPSTGNWIYEFVSEDPFGNSIATGIRWTSDGPGLAPGYPFRVE